MKITKKTKQILKEIKRDEIYSLDKAIKISKKYATAKFDESLDMSFVLGIDAKKSDQQIRGVISLPKMPEKKIRIAVFADGDDLQKAKNAGADFFGSEELIEDIKKSEINFDKCISTPDMMAKVGTLGQILGPKGLMPNPKLGTVTKDIDSAIKKLRAGQIEYKTEKTGIIHASIGKVSFSDEELNKNIKVFFNEIQKNKPTTSKGIFIKKIFLNSTMGPGLQVDISSVM